MVANPNEKKINANYLGSGRKINIFLSEKSALKFWVNRAMNIVNKQPKLLDTVLDRIVEFPELVVMLEKEYGIQCVVTATILTRFLSICELKFAI